MSNKLKIKIKAIWDLRNNKKTIFKFIIEEPSHFNIWSY